MEDEGFDLEGEFSLLEFGLEVVGHGFEGAVAVAELGEAEGVGHQEAFGAEVGPLEDVDEFVEVEGFVINQVFLHEVGVQVGDAGGVQVFEAGKGGVVEAPGAEWWRGEFAGEGDDFGALEEFRRVEVREAAETEGGDGAGLRGMGGQSGGDPVGGLREDAFEFLLQVHEGKLVSGFGSNVSGRGAESRRRGGGIERVPSFQCSVFRGRR